MWLFGLLAAVVVAALAMLVFQRAAAAAKTAQAGEDPALPVYRRQIAELDDLSERGLLGEAEYKAAYAEAGRRLLAVARGPASAERSDRTSRRLVAAGVAATAVVAGAVYLLFLGSPGLPDQPYAVRLAQWRSGDPRSLAPERLAALLRSVLKERGEDPQGLEFLARAELAAGDPVAARHALQKALRLQPGRADLRAMIGETMVMEAQGTVTPEARTVFQEALALDPNEPSANFQLARGEIAAGQVDAGVARLRALERSLPADDPRRQPVLQEIASAGRSQAPSAAAVAQAASQIPQGEEGAFIRSMVAGLSARLQQNPGDAEGWARLVRSYGVLGERENQAQALERARRALAGRPQDLARVEAEARAAP